MCFMRSTYLIKSPQDRFVVLGSIFFVLVWSDIGTPGTDGSRLRSGAKTLLFISFSHSCFCCHEKHIPNKKRRKKEFFMTYICMYVCMFVSKAYHYKTRVLCLRLTITRRMFVSKAYHLKRATFFCFFRFFFSGVS